MQYASSYFLRDAGHWPGKGFVNSGNCLESVDQEVAPIIRRLSELGLATITSSSAGHYRDGIFSPPYLALRGEMETLRILYARLHSAYQGHQLVLPWNMAGGFDRWNDLIFNLHVDAASYRWPRTIGVHWIDSKRWRHIRKQIDNDLKVILTVSTQAAKDIVEK